MNWQRIDSVEELPREDLVLAECSGSRRDLGPACFFWCPYSGPENSHLYMYDGSPVTLERIRGWGYTHFATAEGLE